MDRAGSDLLPRTGPSGQWAVGRTSNVICWIPFPHGAIASKAGPNPGRGDGPRASSFTNPHAPLFPRYTPPLPPDIPPPPFHPSGSGRHSMLSDGRATYTTLHRQPHHTADERYFGIPASATFTWRLAIPLPRGDLLERHKLAAEVVSRSYTAPTCQRSFCDMRLRQRGP